MSIVLLHRGSTTNRGSAILVVQVPNGTEMWSPSYLSFGTEVVQAYQPTGLQACKPTGLQAYRLRAHGPCSVCAYWPWHMTQPIDIMVYRPRGLRATNLWPYKLMGIHAYGMAHSMYIHAHSIGS